MQQQIRATLMTYLCWGSRLKRPRKTSFGFFFFLKWYHLLGSPGVSDSKESTCNAGDTSVIPGVERFPREGNGNPLQDSCLENPLDRGILQVGYSP